MMLYGLCGASGVGKTTVGELIADALDVSFQRTSLTEVATRHGYNSVGMLNLSQRIDLQEKFLQDHLNVIGALKGVTIIDRTPIDFAAYMLAEVYMTSAQDMTQEDIQRISAYVVQCMWAAKRNYDFIFHLAPLPFYEQSTTRPIENSAYQRHVDLLIRGLLSEMSGSMSHAILNTTDLNERQDFIHDIIVDRLDSVEAMRKSNPGLH